MSVIKEWKIELGLLLFVIAMIIYGVVWFTSILPQPVGYRMVYECQQARTIFQKDWCGNVKEYIYD